MKGALKARREELRLTQKALAELLGVSQQTVARWEATDEIPRKHLRDVVIKLGMSISEFLKDDPATFDVPTMKFPDGPIGTVHFSVGNHLLSYPTGWSQVNGLFQRLSKDYLPMKNWEFIETLDQRVVYINTRSLNSIRWVDEAQEEMPSFEHEEVYRAASELALSGIPTQDEINSESYPYSRELVDRASALIREKGEEQIYGWLHRASYILSDDSIGKANVSENLLWTMHLLLIDGLEQRKFVDLTTYDESIKLVPAERLSLLELPYLEVAAALKKIESET
ncbi:helix-turn-helix transcriptional regulator [Pseudomonas sp. AAC]|uniref:helix-turn-helix transcriptional regulator n=1 Tax=Pseudomonas sp. AAC TaxID=1502784 RepID=UPI0004D94982|nr:helix-turn-helix transcriptional regulator [Pseudomonas sp. AAC]KES25014.1 hypothetical protein FG99_02620 [Pseudomonas sp. AAC]